MRNKILEKGKWKKVGGPKSKKRRIGEIWERRKETNTNQLFFSIEYKQVHEDTIATRVQCTQSSYKISKTLFSFLFLIIKLGKSQFTYTIFMLLFFFSFFFFLVLFFSFFFSFFFHFHFLLIGNREHTNETF